MPSFSIKELGNIIEECCWQIFDVIGELWMGPMDMTEKRLPLIFAEAIRKPRATSHSEEISTRLLEFFLFQYSKSERELNECGILV